MRYILFIIALLTFADSNGESTPAFAELIVELDDNQSLPLDDRVRFELVSSNVQEIVASLANWNGITTSNLKSDSVLITMSPKPRFSGKVRQQHALNSFVVDIDEESTQRFVSGFLGEFNDAWVLSDLASYVDDYIDNPTYIHGFNIASVVATQRSGDCTEHAVLATALARSLNLPARVILGSVIVEEKDRISAFGHAWAEVWYEEKWHILDPALNGSGAVQHFYLPASELDKENPGFMLSLAKAVGLFPHKIHKLRSF